MRIHAVQTGTVMIKTRQRRGVGSGFGRMINTLRDPHWTEPLPILVWVIEHPEGVMVVDTGENTRSTQPGYFPGWHPYYKHIRIAVQPDEEIAPRLQALGIQPDSIRWVVMTHLHTDHAGGLYHFPKSEILITRAEVQATQGLSGQIYGYVQSELPAWLKPRFVDFAPTPIGGFDRSLTLTQAGDVHLVPTPGHSPGHLSVIAQDDGLTYFLAGDVSYTQALLLEGVVDGVSADERAARDSLARTLRTVTATPTVYLPTHDPDSVGRLAQKSTVSG